MFFTVHASVGAVLADTVGDESLGFTSGFLSHFFLDAVPHGDEAIGKFFSDGKHNGWLAVLLLIDLTTAFAVLTLFWMNGFIRNPVAAYAGALGAVLPDILSGVTVVSRNKLWPSFTNLHNSVHRLFGQEFSISSGYVIQIAVFASVWLAARL
ncbi:MAG: hypothetical protein WC817_00610 [Patescibacteria group bacterium]|jgi:hypothetical protein